MSTYYHVTEIKNLDAILEQGLLPLKGDRSRLLNEAQPAIYVFPGVDSLEDALGGWLGDQYEEDVDLVFIELDSKACGVPSIPREDGPGYEVVFNTPIPVSAIVKVFDERWDVLHEFSGDQAKLAKTKPCVKGIS